MCSTERCLKIRWSIIHMHHIVLEVTHTGTSTVDRVATSVIIINCGSHFDLDIIDVDGLKTEGGFPNQ